ncbi:MAG: hypothetical protein P8100_15630 [bacterium]|jgi:hypothetical protein
MLKLFISRITLAIATGFLALTVVLQSCESESAYSKMKVENPLLREVVVKEVLQTSSYTYLKFEEENDSYWAAISRREDIRNGGTYYFDNYMEMKNFQSKELDRNFESIYFIENLADEPFASPQMVMPEQTGSSKVGNHEIEGVEPVEGGITIGELFENRREYDGKLVKIKGIVVKYSPAIMSKNWVHIQDGTSSKGDFDLAITTTDECGEGDQVVFEGTVNLDRDFGYGYTYEVIIEDARLVDIEKVTTLQ